MNITLRTVRDADRPFLLSVYASVRAPELEPLGWGEELKAAFIQQQFDAQDRGYRSHFHAPSLDVILVDGESAGRLYVDRLPDELRVVDISLLPEYRRRGCGATLLKTLQAEAAASGRCVTLHVERFNPAQRLYARLGFELAAEGPVYLLMKWPAQARLPGTG